MYRFKHSGSSRNTQCELCDLRLRISRLHPHRGDLNFSFATVTGHCRVLRRVPSAMWMNLFTGIIFCFLILGVSSQGWGTFLKEAGQGAKDMWKAYSDMKEANYKGADKYFHARGNYDAAQRGPGGAWAAKVISNARETIQGITDPLLKGMTRDQVREDSKADQFANEWGRSGKDPNRFRPAGLPDKY
nr:serum amyloid A protein isoform X4 [Bubalus bubalis]